MSWWCSGDVAAAAPPHRDGHWLPEGVGQRRLGAKGQGKAECVWCGGWRAGAGAPDLPVGGQDGSRRAGGHGGDAFGGLPPPRGKLAQDESPAVVGPNDRQNQESPPPKIKHLLSVKFCPNATPPPIPWAAIMARKKHSTDRNTARKNGIWS